MTAPVAPSGAPALISWMRLKPCDNHNSNAKQKEHSKAFFGDSANDKLNAMDHFRFICSSQRRGAQRKFADFGVRAFSKKKKLV